MRGELKTTQIQPKINPKTSNKNKNKKKNKKKEKEISPEGDIKKNAPCGASPSPVSSDWMEIALPDCKEALLTDELWTESVCMNMGISPIDFAAWLEDFFRTLQNRGESKKTVKDAKHHFASWLRIELNRESDARQNSKTGGTSSADDEEDFMRSIAEGIARADYERQRRAGGANGTHV